MTTTDEIILSFKEWRGRSYALPADEGAAALEISADYFPAETKYLIIYPGGLYIEQLDDDSFHLQLGWHEWTDTDIRPLEEKLYCREYAA